MSASLGLAPVLLLAMAGAVAGDGVSYWLGHHYRESLRSIWPFSRYPEILNKGASCKKAENSVPVIPA
jgi:undecaprenyl-diphosphatase